MARTQSWRDLTVGIITLAALVAASAFVLVFAGCGAIMVDTKDGALGQVGIALSFGLAIMVMIYAVGHVSGAHFNPAVTLANCVYRGMPWRKFPVYAAGQVLGAMAGAFVVYANYRDAIDAFEGGSTIRTVGLETSSAGVFCTYPVPHMNRTSMVWSEFIATAILIFVIFALVDPNTGNAGEFAFE